MKIIKIIPIVLLLLSSLFLGCVKPPVETPTPTMTPTPTETVPAVFPTVSPAFTPLPISTPVLEPIMYRVWVDSDFGFYRVRAIRGSSPLKLPSDFNILNFTIKVGDNLRWMNDDSYDFPITIASKEGLWAGRTGLMRYQTEHFDYTFNRTGTYTFYVEEFPRIQNQTITVKP